MMHNLIKDLMRDLLVMAAREALGWRDVESVEIGLELSNRFEDNGWDGRVRLRLSGGRDFSYIFSAQELQYTCHPNGMIDGMRRAFDGVWRRRGDGSAWEEFDARVRVGDTAVLEAERRHTKEQAAAVEVLRRRSQLLVSVEQMVESGQLSREQAEQIVGRKQGNEQQKKSPPG